MKLGPTGEYPQGKLNESDNGELTIAVLYDEVMRKIILQFGKNINWIGMDAAQARAIAEMLLLKAQMLEKANQDEKLDWDKALKHFRAVRKQYQDLVNTPDVNTRAALKVIFHPLVERYYRGERTPELYREMMSVE